MVPSNLVDALVKFQTGVVSDLELSCLREFHTFPTRGDPAALKDNPATRKSQQSATGNLKRVTLELGGKSPNIIFSDTDLESAIPAAATTIFRNTGQVCCAGSRLYVEKKVFDRVVDGVAERAKAMKLGAAFNSESEIGPLMSEAQLNRVQPYVHDGTDAGAKILTGGKHVGERGYFYDGMGKHSR